jgi:hypothetical protein
LHPSTDRLFLIRNTFGANPDGWLQNQPIKQGGIHEPNDPKYRRIGTGWFGDDRSGAAVAVEGGIEGRATVDAGLLSGALVTFLCQPVG